mgnify:CR=1 FL=1
MCTILLAESKNKKAELISLTMIKNNHQVQVVKNVAQLESLVKQNKKHFCILLVNQNLKGGEKDFNLLKRIKKMISKRTAIIGYSKDVLGGLKLLRLGGQDFAYQNGGELPDGLIEKVNKWAVIADKENLFFDGIRRFKHELNLSV